MANKVRDYDNSKFLKIAGTFQNYDKDLTQQARDIIDDTIKGAMKGTSKPYGGFKVYYIIYHTCKFSMDQINRSLDQYQAYHGSDISQGRPGDSTIRKFRTVAKAVSIALVDAHKRGVKLFIKQEEGKHYMDNMTFENLIRKAQHDGASVEDLIVLLQKHCENE
ncbi:hypothetical protein [Kluyvera cryocrescens]|uniref:hypothetical protein n=1 Tax=Kluyvera cryocrescens TaxID=580 RepID=UPI00248C2E6F|nr:hypothetical protein [Kluyvera cryocrescens]